MKHTSFTVSTNILPSWAKVLLICSVFLQGSGFAISGTFGAWQATASVPNNSVTTSVWSAILTPLAEEVVSGSVLLSAYYGDENGDNNDGVQWAVRAGTCSSGAGTVFGNVDSYNTPFTWNNTDFSATIDTTTVPNGHYCFVFNPSEDSGNTDVRLTRYFFVENEEEDDSEGLPTLVTITGNTSAGENQLGWMFGRDLSNQTPFEFNEEEASIGSGSLFVAPIGSNPSDKFIAELFMQEEIADINSISYDFNIAGVNASDASDFYMNVYANFGESSPTKFYDCRYNVVPASGILGDWTTTVFDPDANYAVAQHGTSPHTCPTSPAGMDLLSPGSTLRVVAFNVGDTSVSDAGVSGYLDNVVVDMTDGVTTYDFEPLTCSAAEGSFDSFTLGSVTGQGGWSSTGPFDQEVVTNTYGHASFNCQALRISNAVTSGSFGNQTFSPSVVDEAGETGAQNGGLSGGTRQTHFEAEFDIATAQLAQQPGLALSVSPDRGDGARMSYLSFTDTLSGIDVVFADVQSTTNPAVWTYTTVASGLSRIAPHTIKFEMDFLDGPSNDVVKIYIDGDMVHEGTSWENYYRFDDESNPSLDSGETRTVDSLLFRVAGAAVPGTFDKGFLIDNYTLMSSGAPEVPFVPGPGDVVINEIMWMGSDPSEGGSIADEWVELRNMTDEDIDLSGWTIDALGTNPNPEITIPSGVIAANGYFLVGNYASDHANSAVSDAITVDHVDAGIQLINDGETLVLTDADDVIIDETPAGEWAAGNNVAGNRQSMERNLVPGVGTEITSWHTCIDSGCASTAYWDEVGSNYGTPRAENLSENDPTSPDYIDQDWSYTVDWVPDENDELDDSERAVVEDELLLDETAFKKEDEEIPTDAVNAGGSGSGGATVPKDEEVEEVPTEGEGDDETGDTDAVVDGDDDAPTDPETTDGVSAGDGADAETPADDVEVDETGEETEDAMTEAEGTEEESDADGADGDAEGEDDADDEASDAGDDEADDSDSDADADDSDSSDEGGDTDDGDDESASAE